MAVRKKEEVSASFHYLVRMKKAGNAESVVPISETEFESLFAKMTAQKPFDPKSEEDNDRLRYRLEAPLENVEMLNPRTITGTFKASYWGHAYDNTLAGRISADSVNLRPFHFVLYLADSGLLYVGSQYLGLFGGYETLRKTLVDMMSDGKEVRSRSFRLGASYYQKAQPREIRVSVASKGGSLGEHSSLGGKMMIALTRNDKDDPLVERVRNDIIPYFGSTTDKIKGAVAGLINESEVVAIDDDDVIDCTVLADLNGKRTTIYMFDNGIRATRFTLDVEVDNEGHPSNADTCNEILLTLNEHVIQVTENG